MGGGGGGGEGEEANEKMFLCLYVTSNGYLKKATERNTQYSRTGKRRAKGNEINKSFLKDQCNVKF